MVIPLINFAKKIAKAIAGFAVTVLSLPVVNTVLNSVPLEWTIENVIAGTLVGVTVYAVPNKGDENGIKK